MKVLVIGNGGREHCIAEKISQSKKVSKVFLSSHNGGWADCLNFEIKSKKDIIDIANWVVKNNIEWVFIGPELPLTLGAYDIFISKNIKCIGPNQESSILESSKLFTKGFCTRNNIQTAGFYTFTQANEAIKFIKQTDHSFYPLVIKADGLAGGKGVFICKDKDEALDTVKSLMIDKLLGDSGSTILIEDFIDGEELSVLAFCDGDTILPLIYAKDYKKSHDNNKGLNTGGMGSFAKYCVSDELNKKIENEIISKTLYGFKKDGINYQGIIYAGLIINSKDGNIKLLEYNIRLGDPETQSIIPLMKTDLIDIFEHIYNKTLKSLKIEWDNKKSVCIVLASSGYPLKYEKGIKISNLDLKKIENETEHDFNIYHAGTKRINNEIITNSGRVLNIVVTSKTHEDARRIAYKYANIINYENKYFRNDIGLI